jgi:SAM-dependent methyltransferase
MAPGHWNHNIHYYSLVLAAVPPGASRALDIGCGDGRLTRELRQTVPEVTGVDPDAPSLAIARESDAGMGINYVYGDFLSYDAEPGSVDFICSVAALHHMDARSALGRMRYLLRPGGRLAIIGCARSASMQDWAAEAGGTVAHRLHRYVLRKGYRGPGGPICWPPAETYAGMRRLATSMLPGVQFRRRLLWRYSLVWTKPVD